MMSHVQTEARDFPLFKKFMDSACARPELRPTAGLPRRWWAWLEKGEEVDDWIKVAGGGFEEATINTCSPPYGCRAGCASSAKRSEAVIE